LENLSQRNLDEDMTADEKLLEAHKRIIELEAASKTSLSGGQFLCLIMLSPLFLSFCALGILIIYRTVSKPAEVAPHLEPMLLAMALFSAPVTAAASTIVALMSDEIKAKIAMSGGKDE